MYAVTGAAGRLGNVLVRELKNRYPDTEVISLVLPGEDTSSLAGVDTRIVEGDITDLDSLKAAFNGAEGVFHLAGYISLMPGDEHILERVNVEGTRNVVEACKYNNVKRLVHTASANALSEPRESFLMDENRPICPETALGLYGRSKAKAAKFVLESSDEIDAVVVCPTGVIGPYDFGPSNQGEFLIDIINKSFVAYTDGAYDFVDARDVVDGMIRAFHKGTRGEYYILSGDRMPVRDMLRIGASYAHKKIHIPVRIPRIIARLVGLMMPTFYRLTHTKPVFTAESIDVLFANSFISNAKARKDLGYHPRSAYESIIDTLSWFRIRGHFNHS